MKYAATEDSAEKRAHPREPVRKYAIAPQIRAPIARLQTG
jgi:hypothetical protein